MRIGDLTTSTKKLRLALQKLQTAWIEARGHWHDDNARHVEEVYLQALAPRLKATLEATERLEEVFTNAQRECTEKDDLLF